MPLPFDATWKDLVRRHPGDYVRAFRLGDASDVRPLSVLGSLPEGVSDEDGVADIVERLCRRLEGTHDQEVTNHVLTSTFVLSGLRLKRERAINVFRRIRAVEESTTYQHIIEQGELKGVRRMLLEQGAIKFGTPTKNGKAAIQELEELPRLRRMEARLVTAASWSDVLETP